MSTVYRKSGNRIFYKVEGGFVTKVIDKYMDAGIMVTRNTLILSEALDEDQISTKEEFNTAYKEAMERISSGKL